MIRIAVASVGLMASAAWALDQNFGVTPSVLEWVQSKWGPEARVRVASWPENMQASLQNHSTDEQKLTNANDFFNQVRWVADLEHWQKEDYWATPIETLATNAGDCEDFSIGKYFTLLHTQLALDKLRITYVKALEYNQAHMVLAYYPSPDAEPLILDNINKTILPASQREDLLPVYSFNGDGLWLAKARAKKLTSDTQKNLPQWREVNERMLREMNEAGKPTP
ncbi:transglutaminase-like cysteine peptidase [Simiduia agarivorans]|uniref:Sulfate adenylyltransferase, small subunit n=1 Tax=Simiduia agarivorans (strain DSM 21679 / JCM 13881 / BCRC 17597 / SA1) TaxID=1117647 RepID=K4KE13_SIMAS|nr:transglutaminase-like cysteine peptidase [Simiduia agarivorans]AFU97269.1 Sulfate adenylyltransferase, small subunit [Simiduia agarivorans SA1 = DSM 21679]